MCNNCNCEEYEKCSIVGYMPIGFCCSKCILYDEVHTCLISKARTAPETAEEEIKLITSSIEGKFLKVVIEKKGQEIPIYIDLQKHLGN